ncbi:DNA glycosylase [Tissierella sp. Yu-01]|uniref:DNA-3-methyladenine glycosylase family protein n=1 Tax=Tissierella sp. Yu-01 TaxID=3035694 RepID=UPI00240DC8E5|nr:DNA glycosylase [Tissierella sp. Yu-01]WFA08726.1 DNA glycosylase [Tissierella sp. Yu-01]
MNYNIIEENNKIIIKNILDFDPKHIFECGQCFRWYVEEDGSYTTIAYGKVLNVKKVDNDIILSNTNMDDFNNIWYNYFDLGKDYWDIKKELSKDPILEEAIKFGNGMRLLNQEPYETIISFIISANNQIPRIKKAVELISTDLGEYAGSYNGKDFYSFPKPEKLANLEVGYIKEKYRVGFRADRIKETSRRIYEKEFDLDCLYNLSRDDGKNILTTLPGVGPKVSDCILLFAFDKEEAFPVDVWVKRVMEYFYLKEETNVKHIGTHGARIFGRLAGYAQQYLFYYARELGIGK